MYIAKCHFMGEDREGNPAMSQSAAVGNLALLVARISGYSPIEAMAIIGDNHEIIVHEEIKLPLIEVEEVCYADAFRRLVNDGDKKNAMALRDWLEVHYVYQF